MEPYRRYIVSKKHLGSITESGIPEDISYQHVPTASSVRIRATYLDQNDKKMHSFGSGTVLAVGFNTGDNAAIVR
jgi:hypothetical protein